MAKVQASKSQAFLAGMKSKNIGIFFFNSNIRLKVELQNESSYTSILALKKFRHFIISAFNYQVRELGEIFDQLQNGGAGSVPIQGVRQEVANSKWLNFS